VVRPRHTVGVPVIVPGKAFTVMTLVREQPRLVYVIVVVPADRPLSTPAALIVPTAKSLLLQAPTSGKGDALSVIVALTQTAPAPVIAPGKLLTVTISVAEQPFAVV
jgi:hypothetical protein